MDWRRHPANLTRRLPDGWLILAPSAETPVLLSGSAAALWDALELPSSTPRIVSAICDTFHGDPEQIEIDVRRALAELVEWGIVEELAP